MQWVGARGPHITMGTTRELFPPPDVIFRPENDESAGHCLIFKGYRGR